LFACLLSLPAQANDATQVLGLIARQITQCWSRPADADRQTVSIRLRLKIDGALDGEPSLVGEKAKPSPYGLSALRAVTRCAPFSGLDAFAGDFETWRDIVLNFKG
jgi:hypothetical protein